VIRVESLDLATLSDADVRRWSDLATQAGAPNPFYEPGFILPTVTQRPSRPATLLVAAGETGDWLGAMPLERHWSWRRLVAPTATWSDPLCLLEAPLVVAGREAEVVQALLAAARRRVGLVAFRRVPRDGALGEALTAACDALGAKPVVWDQFERAALERRPTDDYIETAATGKRRGEVRRRARALAAELGGEVTVVDRAGDPTAVEEFLTLEAAGWKGERGTALATSSASGFMSEMCRAFAMEGRLQLLALEAGGHTAAMQCNLIAGNSVFGFKKTYDESLARFGPGVQLVVEAASAFHARTDLMHADSCAEPDSETVNRFWPGRRRLATLLVPGEGAVGSAARAEAALAANARQRIRERRRG